MHREGIMCTGKVSCEGIMCIGKVSCAQGRYHVHREGIM